MRRLGTMAARSISAALPRLRLCLKPRSLLPFLNAPSDPMAEALISEKRAVDRCDAIALRHSSILLQIPVNTATLQFSCKIPVNTAHGNSSVGEKGSFSQTVWAPVWAPVFPPVWDPVCPQVLAPVCPMLGTLGRFKGTWGFFWVLFHQCTRKFKLKTTSKFGLPIIPHH